MQQVGHIVTGRCKLLIIYELVVSYEHNDLNKLETEQL